MIKIPEKTKLNTCPFCNSWDIQVYADYIHCDNCNEELHLNKELMKKLIRLQEYDTLIQQKIEFPPKHLDYFKKFYEDMVKISLGE